MAKTLIRSFTSETIRELVQEAGFRAEIVSGAAAGAPVIRSASSGLAFEIRLLNPVQTEPKSFADLTFTAGLQVQGPLALEIVNRWNATKRFSRLYVAQGFLIIAMDIVLQGGVPPEHLRAQIEIWDRLLQELLAYLRTAAAQTAPKKVAPEVENKDAREPALANDHAEAPSADAPDAEPIAPPPEAEANAVSEQM